MYFPQVWRLGSRRPRHGHIQSLVTALLWPTDGAWSLCPHMVGGGARQLSGVSLTKTLIPSMRAPPSWANPSQSPRLLIPSSFRLGFQHMKLEGYKYWGTQLKINKTDEQKEETTNHPLYFLSERTNVCILVQRPPAALQPPLHKHVDEVFFKKKCNNDQQLLPTHFSTLIFCEICPYHQLFFYITSLKNSTQYSIVCLLCYLHFPAILNNATIVTVVILICSWLFS